MLNYKLPLITSFLLSIVLFSLNSSPVKAANEPKFTMPDPQITITKELTEKLKNQKPVCDTNEKGQVICKNTWLAEYIAAIYKYAVGIVGILATVVMMIGGFIWITAGGNAGRVSDAKNWIYGALTGLVLTFSSYLILYQVNPKTTTLTPITYKQMAAIPTCCNSEGYYSATKEVDKNGNIKYHCEKDSDVCEEPKVCAAAVAMSNSYACIEPKSGCCLKKKWNGPYLSILCEDNIAIQDCSGTEYVLVDGAKCTKDPPMNCSSIK